jgi:hypothetical protein
MNVSSLRNRISAAVQPGGLLALTAAEYPELGGLLSRLHLSRLLVSGASVEEGDGALRVSGTGDLLGATGALVTLESAAGSEALSLTLGLPETWSFADAFPGLPPSFRPSDALPGLPVLQPSLLYALTFTAPRLVVSDTEPGIAFGAGAHLPAGYENLAALLALPDALTVTGTITLPDGGAAQVDLAMHAGGKAVTVSDITVDDVSLHVRTRTGGEGLDLTVLELEGTLPLGRDVKDGDGNMVAAPRVRLISSYGVDNGVLGFTAQAAPGAITISRGIDAVVELAGGSAGEFALPPGLDVLDSFYLAEIGAELETDRGIVRSLRVWVGSDRTWTVVKDLVAVSGLRFGWLVGYPFATNGVRWVSGALAGTLELGSGRKVRFDVGARAGQGWQIEGRLRPGDTIDLLSLVQTALGFTADLPAIVIDRLEIGARSGGEFSLAGGLSSDWAIDVAHTTFTLQRVTFELESTHSSKMARLYGRADVAGTLLFMQATVDSTSASAAVVLEGGTVPGGEPIHLTAVVAWLLEMVGITLPSDVPDVLLDNLNLRFNTATREFHFEGEATSALPIPFLAGVKSIHAAVNLTSSVGSGGKRTLLGSMEGDLTLGGSIFTFQYTMGQASDTFEASWKAKSAEDTLEFEEIAGLFGFEMPELPEGLRLSLKQASFTYDFTHKQLVLAAESLNYGKAALVADASGDQTRFLFGLALDTGISLTDLPVVGQAIPPELAFSIDGIALWLTSAPVDAEYARAAGRLIPAGGPVLPAAGLGAGATLSVDLRLGPSTHTLTLGTAPPRPASLQAGAGAGAPAARQPPAATTTGTGTPAPATATDPSPGPATAPATVRAMPAPRRADDGATWLDVQKTLGPLSLQRIGVRYRDGRISVLFDAGLSIAGFSFSLLGLQVSSALEPPLEVALGLDGLGLEVARDPLFISGAFLRASDPAVDWKYAGLVNARFGELGLAAVGAYARKGGQSSLFVFGSMDTPLGGPPAFFVTGLSAGLGFNSRVRVPGQDEVQDFPLVAGLSAAPRPPGEPLDPLAVLDRLQGRGPAPWITDEPGQVWIAAGVQFTSFKMVNTRALLLANLGERDLSFALLGLSEAQLPPSGGKLFARVGLQLAAVVKPREGFLGVTAVLTRNSWLLDPNCRLTGGFAFSLWFDGPHEGDFVLTVGGYHPSFPVPAHYPRVERLGFNWPVSDAVTLKGGTYFALTPSCIMAGVALEATFSSGNLKAWFRASADFLAQWHPFHFDARVAVRVGASYRLNLLFTTVTPTVEIGAELHLWGPPMGGTVHVDWTVISFTIPFGDQPDAQPDTLDWTRFSELLPPPDARLTLNLEGVQAGAGGERLARPDELSFSARAAIPATELAVGSIHRKMDALSIRPMGIRGVTTPLTVTVRRDDQVVDLGADGWVVETLTQNQPEALWGAPLDGTRRPAPAAALLPDQLAGVRVRAPRAAAGPTPGPMDVERSLGYDAVDSRAPLPLDPERQRGGPAPATGPDTVAGIASQADSDAARAARAAAFAALAALGAAPAAAGGLAGMARDAALLFTDAPMRAA